MNDIADTYSIERVEQMRAIADRLRMRITELLAHQQMTVAQLSEYLHLAHAKVHYHVRELEQVGLVRLVETRAKGGILEKYYRAVAKNITISPNLLSGGARDETVELASRLLAKLVASFLRALTRMVAKTADDHALAGMSASSLFVTEAEADELSRRMSDLLEPFQVPRGVEGEREVTLVRLVFTDDDVEDEPVANQGIMEPASAPGAASLAPTRPLVPIRPAMPGRGMAAGGRKREHTAIFVGATAYSRAQLEAFAARGERLAIYALGAVTFEEDVAAELVERVVRRTRIRGRVTATAAVRAVLERKEKE